ncbi:MAG: sigma-70 family RNA polymerase sigma factor [Pirellulales bacterium]|nr:sigma-70 family RNA polymerase sigma factor [Pirellulales bacterium]
MPLTEIDRNLLERCLQRKPRAWEDFVNRFMSPVLHVVNHTAQARGITLTREDQEDICAEVFLAIVHHDFALLRNFRGQSSLSTYLTVVARRIVVKELLARRTPAPGGDRTPAEAAVDPQPAVEQRLGDREEIDRLLSHLQGAEANVVRLYHLEGKSYHEISAAVGIPENSIGPLLSRARQKLRKTENA